MIEESSCNNTDQQYFFAHVTWDVTDYQRPVLSTKQARPLVTGNWGVYRGSKAVQKEHVSKIHKDYPPFVKKSLN